MTHEVTANADKEVDANTAAITATALNAQNVAIPTSEKRLKTFGEKKFNWVTYGGFSLLGNEAASLVITHARENWGWAKKLYDPFANIFTSMKSKYVPEYVKNGGLPKVIVATIGGMFMVPFVKYMEDHKGEIVRAYDKKHYRARHAESDPAILAAHAEMDEAPKQSWGSLWKGRVATVLSAITVDGLMGWKDAPSTKLVNNITKEGSAWRNYSSMDRIATQISKKSMNAMGITGEASRKNWGKWLQNGSWLLVLSSTLTVLFYFSSKFFAKKRDEKIERRGAGGDGALRDDTVSESAPETIAAKTTEQPEAKVTGITREATLGTREPQLAASH